MFAENRGFYFSAEAAVSIALLGSLLALSAIAGGGESDGLTELQIFQKENDLLKLWAMQGIPSSDEMQEDVRFAFPGKSALLTVDGQEFLLGKRGERCVASGIVFFDREMGERRVELKVFH